MADAAHTPGPWRHATKGNFGNIVEGPSGRKNYDGDDGYRAIASVQSCTGSTLYSVEEENQAANIALIVAAPDMLVLLKELIDIEGPQPGTSLWAEKVQSAIAKAEGR